jgi:uncharacterized protein YbaR (Trm112 family)
LNRALVDLLECPSCHGALDWQIEAATGDEILEAVARCTRCRAPYDVRDGIAALVTGPGAADLWAETESGLARYLAAHRDVERALLGSDLRALAPADRFFRAYVLEERGHLEGARVAEEAALETMYPREQRECHARAVAYVVAAARDAAGTVVDVASGRGRLVEAIARERTTLVVATDVSPVALRRARHMLGFLGVAAGVSFLAFDARRTPFRDRSVAMLTSNVGLQNVQQPGSLLVELRRIAEGRLLAVSQLFQPDDAANRAAAEEGGFAELAFRDTAVAAFGTAGWHVAVASSCLAPARPTPDGELIAGARIDGFPVAATTAEWCVLDAS